MTKETLISRLVRLGRKGQEEKHAERVAGAADTLIRVLDFAAVAATRDIVAVGDAAVCLEEFQRAVEQNIRYGRRYARQFALDAHDEAADRLNKMAEQGKMDPLDNIIRRTDLLNVLGTTLEKCKLLERDL